MTECSRCRVAWRARGLVDRVLTAGMVAGDSVRCFVLV
jgi:hypothetical protein